MSKASSSIDMKTLPKTRLSQREGVKYMSRTKENIQGNINNPNYPGVMSNNQHQKHMRPSTSIDNNKGVRNSSSEQNHGGSSYGSNAITGTQVNPLLMTQKSPMKSSFQGSGAHMLIMNTKMLPEITKRTPEKFNVYKKSSSASNNNNSNNIDLQIQTKSINSFGGMAPSMQNYIHHQQQQLNATSSSSGGIIYQNQSSTTTAGSSGNTSVQHMDISSSQFQSILAMEKDQRFRYLVKHGTIKRIEMHGNLIFAQLPQIQGVWVCYRRPVEREKGPEKLNLDSLDLSHMPLLEGEEKLKILTYQHNKISQIQNLVSLPSLLYIDLYDNLIREMDDTLSSITQLRVLLLPQNQLCQIKYLDTLSQLEVLDLHSNKIQQIEGLGKLTHLRILNLANNLIGKIEGLEQISNLTEVNLQINVIEHIEGLSHLYKLEKLILSNNRIEKTDSFKQLRTLSALFEVNFQFNPVTRSRQEYARAVLSNSISVHTVDHKSVDQLKEDMKTDVPNNISCTSGTLNSGLSQQSSTNSALNQTSNNNEIQLNIPAIQPHIMATGAEDKISTNNNNKNNHFNLNNLENLGINEVIAIIGQQWEQQLERVNALEMVQSSSGAAGKKDMKKESLVQGGHAQIQDDHILFIYGNAYEIVLSNSAFHDSIETIQLQYVLFDFIIDSAILGYLKKFRKLKQIILKDNHLVSLLQLAQLQAIPGLKSIQIEQNPVCHYSNLKQFIVYRFPSIIQINGKEVREPDRNKAKIIFNQFDQILQLPEKYYNGDNMRSYPHEIQNKELQQDQTYVKTLNQIINENSENFAKQNISCVIENDKINLLIDLAIGDFAQMSLIQLYGVK